MSRRAKFWIGILVFIITLTGFSLKDLWQKETEDSAPSSTSTIPAPAATDGDWGPPRATFTIKKPATYAVLNSITDHPDLGDERRFFRVGISTAENYGYGFDRKTSLKVTPGDVLTFQGYYENSAADNFRVSDPSWIQGATAVLAYDNAPLLLHSVQLSISAANSPTIWSRVFLQSDDLVSLEYVDDSARVYNNAHSVKVGGYKLNFDELQSHRGLRLGYEVMDGVIKPGYEYAGYLYFKMKVVDAS